jgi:hypothetical protein
VVKKEVAMNKRSLRTIGFLAILIVLLSACNLNSLRGSGKLITENRPVSNFDRVTLSGSGRVIITQNGEESLVVETDDNIMEYVTTEVRGGTLELGFDSVRAGPISPTRLTFTLSVDDLEGLTISGSGDIESERIETDSLNILVSGSGDMRIDSLTADTVEAQISGSGEIRLAGEATGQDIEISGSGQYRAEDLHSDTVAVDIGGSGDATVWATNSLNANIGGSGTVNYYGSPTVNVSESGSGSINSKGEK